MMMLVVYCLFSCAICMYFRLWVCNTVIGTVTVDGWTGTASRGLGVVLACSLSKSDSKSELVVFRCSGVVFYVDTDVKQEAQLSLTNCATLFCTVVEDFLSEYVDKKLTTDDNVA